MKPTGVGPKLLLWGQPLRLSGKLPMVEGQLPLVGGHAAFTMPVSPRLWFWAVTREDGL